MGYITLNKKNFLNNLNVISKKAAGTEHIALVLKDNAYGHGLEIIAKIASDFGIRHAVVRRLAEVEKIEKLFDTILVLSGIPTKLYSNSIHFTINSLADIEKILSGSSVELKVDTGMSRNGISEDELEFALKKINEKNLVLKGVFTHHSSAGTENNIFELQNDKFTKIKSRVLSLVANKPRFHSANSEALFRDGLKGDESIARVGIAAYGCLENVFLKSVLSLVAEKIASREIQKGDCVGYDATYKATKKEIISTYDVGYSDGFSRLHKEYFTVKNYKVLGRISMDNISLNSTDDEVVLFDDAREYAKACDTISYEVLVRLGEHLKRKIVG